MKKVVINPGPCNFITTVTAESEDQMEVTVTVKSGCESIRNMMEELGNTYDAYEVCLTKPGCGLFYEYASEKFPGHASCPAINGIIKCIEAECMLALPKDATITFVEE